MSQSFSELPLHDASLHALTFDWVSARLIVRLSVFFAEGTDAAPTELIFHGVTWVDVPRENPWGPSAFVNSPSFEPPDVHVLEMQSGDVIKVRAEAFDLART
ncbi:MAG: hypothetical protein K0R38_956 [Polyangiaceae bacterium]|nr:hypothetical protein [Polyangiaceae bacterium]